MQKIGVGLISVALRMYTRTEATKVNQASAFPTENRLFRLAGEYHL